MTFDQITCHLCTFCCIWQRETIVLHSFSGLFLGSLWRSLANILRGQKNVACESLCVRDNMSTISSSLNIIAKKHFTKVNQYFKILPITKHSPCSADLVMLQQYLLILPRLVLFLSFHSEDLCVLQSMKLLDMC